MVSGGAQDQDDRRSRPQVAHRALAHGHHGRSPARRRAAAGCLTRPQPRSATARFRQPGVSRLPQTIRGGGDPSRYMVIEPFDRMGPLPRSHAAEANDCFMVRPQHGPTGYKGAARSFARNGGLPSVRADGLDQWCRGLLARGNTNMSRQDGEPNLIKRCAALAAVNIASRRLRRRPTADVDRRSAPRPRTMQAGTKKRSSRTKKLAEGERE